MSWTPQPGPQTDFVRARVFEVVYGGARGGGKTDASLGDFSLHARKWKAAAKGLMVRRTRTALEPTIARARRVYRADGARWNADRSCFEWPNGAVLYFRYLANDADADNYQGHDYSRVYVEELTQFPFPGPVDKLKATLRSAAGAPCGFRATCNPGGPGHNWVKARYIDPGPYRLVRETFANPFGGPDVASERTFIPARLGDNPLLLRRDPNYIARLHLSGSKELVRAWLDGDWNVVLGAFFDRWSPANIVAPFAIPEFWTRIRGLDWGFATPFSVGWWAVVQDDFTVSGRVLPRGALVRYREWYGRGRHAGEGRRLTAEEVAAGIREREAGEEITIAVADPSIFNEEGGPSIGERMRKCGVVLWGADNTRTPRAGAMSGWDQMRARIAPTEGGVPMLYVFDTCRDFIRTVPAQQHDPMNLEDLDTRGEDHIADETRYVCMSRPLPAPEPVRQPRGTFDYEALRRRDADAVGWMGQ
ncbi:MAG: terminase large subunit domain-containing protein [Caulobacteraceae bacterium]